MGVSSTGPTLWQTCAPAALAAAFSFERQRPGAYNKVAMTARIRVRLTPRASRDAIDGWRGDALRVRVSAPPVDGRANEALERLIADALGVAPSAVRVTAGGRGRDKTVAVEGIEQAAALARLGKAGEGE
jgi:uncharacterized protein (TIGR00251 family)